MKVLIVRLSAIGDVLQGIPCLVALKESFPLWQISWLVEETSAPLLEGHPHLDKVFVVKRDWRSRGLSPSSLLDGLGSMRQTLSQIRREKFDVAIDLQGLLKSALWTWLSGAPRRVGYDKTREGAHFFLNEYVGDRPTFDPTFPLVMRYLEPARHLGAEISKGHYVFPGSSKEVLAQVDTLLGKMAPQRDLIALSPCSAWASKNWPVSHWIALARELAKLGPLVITGTPADREVVQQIASAVPSALDLSGKTSLLALAEVFRRCVLVIGPDSGPLHLANATGRPRILMLFGSTSWRRSGPFGKGHRSIALDLECQPCFERQCPLKHHRCLEDLQSSRVLQDARDLLEAGCL